MHIYVDADACPVKDIIVRLARQYSVPVTMVTDTSHQLHDGYSRIITVGISWSPRIMGLPLWRFPNTAILSTKMGCSILLKTWTVIYWNGILDKKCAAAEKESMGNENGRLRMIERLSRRFAAC